MQTLLPLLLICCSLGCTTQSPKPVASQPFDPINPATPAQLETAKQRLPLLRADMTDEQVFATLGLSNCYERCFAESGGPRRRFWVSYTLRNGRALHVVRELTGPQKSTLRSVSLDKASWGL